MMSELTHEEKQLKVDEIHPVAIVEYNRMFAASGKSELIFKMSHEAIQFMGEYQSIKEQAEAEGFTMPELFKDTKITLS